MITMIVCCGCSKHLLLSPFSRIRDLFIVYSCMSCSFFSLSFSQMYESSFIQINDLTVPNLLSLHHHHLRSEQHLRWLLQQQVLHDIATDLVRCTPAPQLGDTIVISLGANESVKICRHYSRGFPLYDDNIAPIFLLLPSSSILTIVQTLLLEGKVVLHSIHRAVISNVAHTLRRFLFPWKFAGSFIPLLPSCMLLAVQVPGCFIIGIETVNAWCCLYSRSFCAKLLCHRTH